jgi:hypothetical protein
MINKDIKAVKPDMETLINTLLPDNLTGDITPKMLREVFHKVSLVLQNDHASLLGGGFVNSDGEITHFATGQLTPMFNAFIDPNGGRVGFTAPYDKVVIDGSIYFEVRGSENFKLCYGVDGVPNQDYFAMLSSQQNHIQYRAVLDAMPANKEFSLYVLPINAGTPTSNFQLIKVDLHIYGLQVGTNV